MSGAVYQVHWTPGSDHLVGVCHCGAQHVADDPIDVWAWLLAHPAGHGDAAGDDERAPREPALTAAG
ncbi:MAG TPA: hypothetical protein VFT67_13365 [Jatrophihabitantaceae bacterium]|jgi:hypothetical protein|nr:hypothetical protein [Jatrophihabitantaceae bacterium]